MRAMIFAAGLGTRLKPLTDTLPKALVPLAGKTLLDWQIDWLTAAGIRDITINIHHHAQLMREYVQTHYGDRPNLRLRLSDESDMLLDTGGGLRRAWDSDEAILACNVDILSTLCLKDFLVQAQQAFAEGADGLLLVSERTTQRYLCFDEQMRLTGWTNVSTGALKGHDGRHLAFSGLQVLSPKMHQPMQAMEGDKFSLIDLYLRTCDSHVLRGYVPGADYRMMDVGKIDSLPQAEAFAKEMLND